MPNTYKEVLICESEILLIELYILHYCIMTGGAMQRIDMTDGAMVGRVGSTRVLPSEPACAYPAGPLICFVLYIFNCADVGSCGQVSRKKLCAVHLKTG